MSVQEEIENALKAKVETAIPGIVIQTGPRTVPQLEGRVRTGTVRWESSEANRIEWGQNETVERYELFLLWPVDSEPLDRSDRMADWEAVAVAILADQYLETPGPSPDGVFDTYVAAVAFTEPHEGRASLIATIEVRRVE